jgi:hypothetical protein
MQEAEQQAAEISQQDGATPNGKGSRLEKLEQRISQLEAQKKAILAREKEKARKERTRRLIQIGALSLKYYGLPDEITPQEYERFARRVVAALAQQPAQANVHHQPAEPES